MRKNLVGMTTLAVALSSVTLLGTSYAGAQEPTLAEHSLIPGTIKASDVAAFKDASSLWLSDALVSQGAQIWAANAKFNETTVVHTSVWRDFINDTVYRHATYTLASGEVVKVGGDPALVRPLSGDEYTAMVYLFNNRLTADLNVNLQVDQNGISGVVKTDELGLTSDELVLQTEQTKSTLSSWVNPVCK
ncbi:MAG: hypothetical protein ACXU86_02500 [Archangium sp.]